MKTKRVWSILLVAALLFSLAACGGGSGGGGGGDGGGSVASGQAPASSAAQPSGDGAAQGAGDAFADGPEIEIMIAYAASDETSMGQKTYEMIKWIEEESGGKIKLTVYPNGQLGSDSEMFEGVQTGNITMTYSAPSSQVNYIPELAILDIGGLYKDVESCNAVLKGDYFDVISQYYEKANLKLMSIDVSFFREMSSNKPINSFADFSGVKIRTQENKYHMAYWSALGANPTPLAFGELYIGLQQGLVDAQENPIEVLRASKFEEVQDYMVLTHHIPFVQIVVMNLDYWNELPPAYQEVLNKNIRKANDELIAEGSANVQKAIDELVAGGMTLIELDDGILEQMQVATDACIQEVKKNVDPAVVDAYVEAVRAASK